jgi:hypothetical protein
MVVGDAAYHEDSAKNSSKINGILMGSSAMSDEIDAVP